MSTNAISIGTELRALESQPCEMTDACLHYESACEMELVSAAKNGDQRAFGELYRRYSPSLKWRIRRLVGNLEDTEDVLHDTMIKAFTHLQGFRFKSTFRTWITTIATNSSLMLLRKRKTHAETGFGFTTDDGKELETLELSDPMPNPEQAYTSLQISRRMARAVNELPLGLRAIVQHCHRDEVRLVDAAKALGITESAAKSRMLRARNAIRRRLNNDRSRYLN